MASANEDQQPAEERVCRVRFRGQYEEIPPPVYLPVDDDDEDGRVVRALGPKKPHPPGKVHSTSSSIKKRKFPCSDPDERPGLISINGGRVVFVPAPSPNADSEADTEPWMVNLSDISNLSARPSASLKQYSLVFALKDNTTHKFDGFDSQSQAFQCLVDDAELCGHVIVLDQVFSTPNDERGSNFAASNQQALAGIDFSGRKKRTSVLRNFVSREVKRFVDPDFNLDLTYITRKLIVMALPCQGVRAMMYNNASDVRRFFRSRHSHAFMVYNLNEDNAFKYDPRKLDGRVRNFGFTEHSPPPLLLLIQLCHDMAAFLRQSPSNVVAVHCKAGRGRSGCVACAWLLHARLLPTAAQAIEYYTAMRSNSDVIISLPSQVRYVHYMERIVREEGLPAANVATVTTVFVGPVDFTEGAISLLIRSAQKEWTFAVDGGQRIGRVACGGVQVSEDVCVELSLDKHPLCRVFFNARMLTSSPLTFALPDMDGERDFKGFKLLPSGFSLSLEFTVRATGQRERRRSLRHQRSQQMLLARALDEEGEGVKETVGEEVLQAPVLKDVQDVALPPRIQRKPTGWIKREPKLEGEGGGEGEGGQEGQEGQGSKPPRDPATPEAGLALPAVGSEPPVVRHEAGDQQGDEPRASEAEGKGEEGGEGQAAQ